ncbi:hypothetical protein XANCAGTX0491_007774 [Xanthoria calcicola]
MTTKSQNRIDVHHHFLPPAYTEVIKVQSDPSGWEEPTWSLPMSKDFMSARGIKTTIFSVSAPGVDVMTPEQGITVSRQCNEYGAHLRDSSPSHYGFFAMVPDPSINLPAALSEIKYAFDTLHADGVCLLTRYGKHAGYLGHPEYTPLWDDLNSRHAVVFVHPNHPADTELVNPALPSPLADYTHETTRFALDMITSDTLSSHAHNCKIILSHAGGTLPFIAHRVASALPSLLKHHHLKAKTFSEIMAEMKTFYLDLALGSNELSLPLLLKFTGPRRLLFGSDLPYPTRETMDYFTGELDGYQSGSMSEEDAYAVDCGNALELFPRLKGV